MSTIIRFEQVSKKFILHRERPRSFQEQLIHIFKRKRTPVETFWALQDVSFTIDQGETVGLIGPNGAGKSTILKLIAQILEPTSGQIRVDGRVSALLELGAGFHPDLTGRENIFLNGSILGLSRPDIQRNLEAIIAFADIDQFIDVPVKHYSSGMYVRLGFAVAVHTDPEILLVDEVLSVGDMAFQQKCLDRIHQLQRNGTSILLVSHGLDVVRKMCHRALWLKDAGLAAIGETDTVISAYLAHVQQTSAQDAAHIHHVPSGQYGQRWGSQEAQITEVAFYNGSDTPKRSFLWGEQLRACIRYMAYERIPGPTFGVAIYNENGDNLVGPNSADSGCEIEAIEGKGEVNYILDLPFKPGNYEFTAAIYDRNSVHPFDHHHRMYTFRILAPPDLKPPEGLVQLPCQLGASPRMSAAPRVSLIVVNWNGSAYLEGCLASLLALDYPDFSVTVVDNASTDGSPDFVWASFPQVELIRSSHNRGYGGGANLALRTCLADVAVVLNTDIIVPSDWLGHLIAAMMADPAIGIAGCKMYYPGGRVIQHAGGYIAAPQAWPGHYGLNEEDQGQHDAIRDVDYVIGAAIAVKGTVLEQIGLFDEGYFLYYEDVDLCQRARRAGFRVVYVPAAWLTHLESATTIKGSAAYLEQFSRGRWRFILKHYDPAQILSESIPAEQAWLTRCGSGDRQAATAVYRAILGAVPEIWLARTRDGGGQVQPISAEEQTLIAGQLQTLLAASQPMPEPPPLPEDPHRMNDESTSPASILDQMRAKQQIREQPFTSRLPVFGPLIARLRTVWNSVSTKWYVRPLVQQQNEFNELAVAGIADIDAELRNQAVRLGDLESGLAAEATRLRDLVVRIHDHDAWLIAQDREQSEFVRDLAELRLLLVQMNRLLPDLNERASRLEAAELPQDQERAA